MIRATLLLSAGVLAVAAGAGCGRSEDSAPAPMGAPASDPDDPDVNGIGPKKLRPPLSADEKATSLQGLLDGLPREMYPRPGPDFLIERNESRDWLEEKAAGRAVEVTVRIDGLQLQELPGQKGYYHVDLFVGGQPPGRGRLNDGVPAGKVVLGNDAWPIRLSVPTWTGANSAMARQLRNLKGREAVFRGRVATAAFVETPEAPKLVFAVKLDEMPEFRPVGGELGPAPREVP